MDDKSTLDLKKRDEICQMICKDFILPQEFKEEIKVAIKNHQNLNLKDETIDKILDKSMNLKQNISSLNFSINHFNGYINEYICVYEYNSLKNKDNILSILNPDSSSKTDILHIIKTANGVIIKAGGDVKSGSPAYVLNQYEKSLNSKYHVPFIDYSGYLTESAEKSLSKSQVKRFTQLLEKYPNRKPVKPLLNNLDRITIRRDILKYMATGDLPSFAVNAEWKVPTSRQEVIKIKDEILSTNIPLEKAEWKTLKSHSIRNTNSNFRSPKDQRETSTNEKINRDNERIKKEFNNKRGRVIKFPRQKTNHNQNNQFENDEFGEIDYEYIHKTKSEEFEKFTNEKYIPEYPLSKSGKFILYARKAIKIFGPILVETIIERIFSEPSSNSGANNDKSDVNNNETANRHTRGSMEQRKQPILHEVRGHKRKYSNGKVTEVKPHTRGKK